MQNKKKFSLILQQKLIDCAYDMIYSCFKATYQKDFSI